jgi:hypothetical protein
MIAMARAHVLPGQESGSLAQAGVASRSSPIPSARAPCDKGSETRRPRRPHPTAHPHLARPARRSAETWVWCAAGIRLPPGRTRLARKPRTSRTTAFAIWTASERTTPTATDRASARSSRRRRRSAWLAVLDTPLIRGRNGGVCARPRSCWQAKSRAERDVVGRGDRDRAVGCVKSLEVHVGDVIVACVAGGAGRDPDGRVPIQFDARRDDEREVSV